MINEKIKKLAIASSPTIKSDVAKLSERIAKLEAPMPHE